MSMGASGGPRMRRPGSEDTHRASRISLIILSVMDYLVYKTDLSHSCLSISYHIKVSYRGKINHKENFFFAELIPFDFQPICNILTRLGQF